LQLEEILLHPLVQALLGIRVDERGAGAGQEVVYLPLESLFRFVIKHLALLKEVRADYF
jgi:hypothetical protein